MIVKMKKIIVVAPSDRKDEMLSGIRDLEVLHISEKGSCDSALTSRLSELNKMKAVLSDYPKLEQKNVISGFAFNEMDKSLNDALSKKAELTSEKATLKIQREAIAPWGDFDPQEVKSLCSLGLDFSFYLIGKKELSSLSEEVSYVRLNEMDKKVAIAVLGSLDHSFDNMCFELPQMGLSQIDKRLCSIDEELSSIESKLSSHAAYISSYDKEILKLSDEILYHSVSSASQSEDGFSIITGFMPEEDLQVFKDKASKCSWAYAIDDPSDDDPTPTKVRYNKVTKMMQPLFDMLGTVPGYREYDISTYFLLFLSLFFAMIIGDAAYGVLFLLIGVIMHIKSKKVSNLNLLLYVMSIATIIWGALTGTWFGSEAVMNIPFFRALVIPQIANYPQYFGIDSTSAQNAVMKFCFAVGMIQLSLACVMNMIRNWKQKSLALVADLAWLVMIVSIYFLALMLVIGASVNIKLVFALIIGGLVTVILFGSQAPGLTLVQGLKAGAGGAFTTFLNTISAFGNVMSYIRLFAVGMASLAIAQSFNGMASPMLQGWAFPAGMLILVIGHVLNIVMGMLSVVVHGVRLNLLEFSGQLGMEWAGIPYEPFKRNVK